MGFSLMAPFIHACKKEDTVSKTSTSDGSTTTTTDGSCSVMPEEVEGPYPYPTGELKNPLNRADITGGQAGLPLTLSLMVVNTNASCAVVSDVRVDIWHCNATGYYSGYANQQGVSGTKSYTGDTWLRGYQTSDSKGTVVFNTIYPGWYNGRATHIHLEMYINGVLKKTGQLAFPESISNAVHVTGEYKVHGVNTTSNSADQIFADSVNSETLSLVGDTTNGYTGTFTIGLAL